MDSAMCVRFVKRSLASGKRPRFRSHISCWLPIAWRCTSATADKSSMKTIIEIMVDDAMVAQARRSSTSPAVSASPREIAKSITIEETVAASTRLRIGDFQGKNHTCRTNEANRMPSMRAKVRAGMSVATTAGSDSKGPLASKITPNHHTSGLKRKTRNRMAARDGLPDKLGATQAAKQLPEKKSPASSTTRLPTICMTRCSPEPHSTSVYFRTLSSPVGCL
mmetsp:Transcript_57656/g.137330  ORF Transcript_57656/g.137330 Transcript_57656/m.137330 type:complete len:222 (-) Transcript_57656:697-1362(-)